MDTNEHKCETTEVCQQQLARMWKKLNDHIDSTLFDRVATLRQTMEKGSLDDFLWAASSLNAATETIRVYASYIAAIKHIQATLQKPKPLDSDGETR